MHCQQLGSSLVSSIFPPSPSNNPLPPASLVFSSVPGPGPFLWVLLLQSRGLPLLGPPGPSMESPRTPPPFRVYLLQSRGLPSHPLRNPRLSRGIFPVTSPSPCLLPSVPRPPPPPPPGNPRHLQGIFRSITPHCPPSGARYTI